VTSLEDRLTPAFGLDPTFGTGGVVVSPPGDYSSRPSVLAQPDGHLLVLSNTGGRGGTQVTRYNADGSLDTAFGVGGTASNFAPGRAANVGSAAVGPDGKITLIGRTDFPLSALFEPGVLVAAVMVHTSTIVRLNADGTPDASFGTNGVASIDAALETQQLSYSRLGSDAVYAGHLLADGSLVVTVTGYSAGVKAVRLTPNGAVDPAFGVNGRFDYAPTVPLDRDWVTTRTLATPDGGLLTMRSERTWDASAPVGTALTFVKLTSTGAPDPAFDGDGFLTVPLGLHDGGLDVAAQPDGKLLVATSHSDGSAALAGRSVEVLRLNADGSLDASFGGDGRVEALPDGGYAGYGSLGLLPGGRVVVASGGFLAPGVSFAVLNADGSPADGSGVGVLTYGGSTDPNAPHSSFAVGGVAVAGSRVVVASTIFGPDYWTTQQNRLGLAVLTEGTGAIPLRSVTPPLLPVVGTPPGGGPVLGDPTTRNEAVPVRGAIPDTPPMTGERLPDPTTPVAAPSVARPQPIRVAGDLNGDGVADKVVTAGSTVSVVSGKDGSVLVKAFTPFEASYTGTLNAVFVDVDGDGDGKSELVVSPGQGGGPVVAVYNADGTERGRFWGIEDANFRGGVNLAAGDTNTDGVADLIVTAGQGGGPRVAIFDGKTLGANSKRLVADFYAFEATQTGRATAGVANGLLIFGAGPGGGPRVRGVDAFTLFVDGVKSLDDLEPSPRAFDRFVGDPSSRQGVTLDFSGVNSLAADQPSKVTAKVGDGPAVTVYEGFGIIGRL